MFKHNRFGFNGLKTEAPNNGHLRSNVQNYSTINNLKIEITSSINNFKSEAKAMTTYYAIYAPDLQKLQVSPSKSAQLILDSIPLYINYRLDTTHKYILISKNFHPARKCLRHHASFNLNINCHIILSHHQHKYLLKAITEDPRLDIEIWEQQFSENKDCECTLL